MWQETQIKQVEGVRMLEKETQRQQRREQRDNLRDAWRQEIAEQIAAENPQSNGFERAVLIGRRLSENIAMNREDKAKY